MELWLLAMGNRLSVIGVALLAAGGVPTTCLGLVGASVLLLVLGVLWNRAWRGQTTPTAQAK